MRKCRSCGEDITKSEGADGLWYHTSFGLPPCDPNQVQEDAYRDDEGDKYPVATPDGFMHLLRADEPANPVLHHIPVHDCQENVREIARLRAIIAHADANERTSTRG